MTVTLVAGQSPVLSTGSSSAMSATPVPTDEPVAGPFVGKEKKTRKKRIITEARKEQNRLAQRAYRKRQKELGQRAEAETGNQAHTIRPRELLPRMTDGCNSQLPPDITRTSNHLPSPPDSENKPSELTTSTSSEDTLALGPSPLGLTSTAPHLSVGEDELEEISRQLVLPDPHANARRLFPTTVFSATLHNALALGFDLDRLVGCSVEFMSPFYRPTTPQDNPAALLASTLKGLANEPPAHLRPTLAQVLIPHHASLDLIPLPHLRDRAIMLSAAMPTVFNVWELKIDIYERGGLDVQIGNGRGWGSNQPWRRENWKAAPWFLRKWSMCVEAEKEQLSMPATGRVGEITGDHLGGSVI